MAGSLARAGAQRVCAWLYRADVAASSQSEEAGTHPLSVLVPALWHAGDTGPRLQPGVRPRLALALYRGERHCRSTLSSAQRLCGHRALDASTPFSDLEDAWRDEWMGLVVAYRVDAAGARAWPGHDRSGPHGHCHSGAAYRALRTGPPGCDRGARAPLARFT